MWIKNRNKLLVILVSIILSCGFAVIGFKIWTLQRTKWPINVLDYGEIVFNPLMREPEYADSKLSLQENGMDYTNYWVQTVIAITALYKEDNIEYAENIIQNEIRTFEKYGFFPRPEYIDFEYGWVSCMDAPVIGVAAQMLYEKTGKSEYKDFVYKLVEYIKKDVTEHGFVAKVGGGSWLFEYACVDTNEDNAEFVLNGSLLGTLATYMLAEATQDKDLWKLLEEQIENYKELSLHYLYENNEWCYYMLNEKRVNQPHYIIYEIRLLDALFEVSGDSFFQVQSNLRRDILLRYYKLYEYKDGDEVVHALLLRANAPHYYYIDVFDTKLTFYDSEENIIEEMTLSGNLRENAWTDIIMPQDTCKVVWTVLTKFYEVQIGEMQISSTEISEYIDSSVEINYNADSDGKLFNNELRLIKEVGRANLYGTLLETVEANPEYIFVVEFDNMSEVYFPASCILYDSEGNAVSRYLQDIRPGKCFVSFGLTGFVQKNGALKDITEFNLRIYTDKIEETETIFIGNVYVFNNALEYIQYLQRTDYTLCWEE